MTKKECFFFLLLLFILLGKVSAQVTINSQVIDIETNLPVKDVYVQIKDSKNSTYTNENGFFYLENISSNSILGFSKNGYAILEIKAKDVREIVYLESEINTLKEVTLRTFSSSQLKKVVPDQIFFSKNDIARLPFVLGEKDVFKLIQFTPGVQQGTEGQSDLLVRGGNGSMNLTLIDNIYLHNTAHLGGLFSAVNSDFVQSLDFYKAGFDASYGGKLSSVTDIKTLKPVDSSCFSGSLGLLSAKLTGNMKINKRNHLLISGRRSYFDVFKPFFGDDEMLGKNSNYFLYDFLAKHTLKLSEKDQLETEVYVTRDAFYDKTKGRDKKLNWGNLVFGSTYKHLFSESLSSQTTISNSYYNFFMGSNDPIYNYSANTSFNMFSINHKFIWDKSNCLFKIGASYNKNTLLPKLVRVSVNEIPLEILNQVTYYYDDISAFGDVEFSVSKKVEVKSGIRLTGFLTQSNVLVDETDFYSFEPRVSIKHQLNENQAFKYSYHRLSQFLHQASVSSFSLPADFFVMSTKNLKPQEVNQLSLGYVYENSGFQFNSALFFKHVSHYSEFANGSINNLFSNNLYDDILTGEFYSGGIELSVNRKIDKITLQSALTLSRTLAKFDEINQGNYFPTIFDRPINFNIITNYKLNGRIEFGALFLVASGQNYTRPTDIRIINERPIINFEAKNASRYPTYHRMDLSCTYSFKKKSNWQSKLNLTLYNVYNNRNPFQIYFTTKGYADDAYIEIIEERDYLFPILPTINWLFSF